MIDQKVKDIIYDFINKKLEPDTRFVEEYEGKLYFHGDAFYDKYVANENLLCYIIDHADSFEEFWDKLANQIQYLGEEWMQENCQ